MTGRRSQWAWAVILLAAALLVFGFLSFARRVGAAQPSTGVEWAQASTGPIAIAVEPGSPGWEAGLRPGDLLLEIDGLEVRSALQAAESGWEGSRGTRVHYRVRQGGTERTLEVQPDWRARSEPYTYLSIVGLAFWVSGLFIALRWPVIRGGPVYSLLALCLFSHLVLSHTGRADGLDWAFYWADVVAGSLAPALLVHLGICFARRTLRRPGVSIAAAYVVSLGSVIAAVWLSPGTLGGAYRFGSPILAVEWRDRLEPLLLAGSLFVTLGLLAKSYARSSSGLHRGQLRWLLWGLTVGLGPFVLLYAVPAALDAPPLPNWAQFVSVVPMLFVPAVFTAALARYRLHDLDLIVLRGFAEVSAVFGAFGVYAAVVFLLREAVSDWVQLSRSTARYVGLFVMAVSYPQVRAWVKAGVERAFYAKRYSYRATLLDWARELNAETDLPSLLRRLTTRIRETLGVPRAEVLLRRSGGRFAALPGDRPPQELVLDPGSRETLEKQALMEVEPGSLSSMPWGSYLVSMKVKGRLRAVLVVAERAQPEEPLTTEDRALLGTLAAHAATAIEAARLVTEVRRRAEEIERLQARQGKILESSAVGLLLLGADGRIQDWNRALEEIYGLERGEAIGRRLGDVFPLHVVRRLEREESSKAPHEEGRIFRLGMVDRRGRRIVVNLAISPVDREHGTDGARVVTIDDVSERVKLEEQVLQQERLAALGRLAAGVAHEINTPLTGISSYTQMLMEDCPGRDPRRDLLEKIELQTQRASKITHSLLNLASPERTEPEAVDLNETVQEVLQLFEPQIRGRRIEMQVDLAPDLPVIRGHRGKLQQVLLNLLINSLDALSGGGLLRVRSRCSVGRVVLEVVDDGAGIAEDDLPRIFDPFFSTKPRGQGTGLGLSISYGIVREHGGEIRVESRPGEFTRFRIELPAASSAQAMA